VSGEKNKLIRKIKIKKRVKRKPKIEIIIKKQLTMYLFSDKKLKVNIKKEFLIC